MGIPKSCEREKSGEPKLLYRHTDTTTMVGTRSRSLAGTGSAPTRGQVVFHAILVTTCAASLVVTALMADRLFKLENNFETKSLKQKGLITSLQSELDRVIARVEEIRMPTFEDFESRLQKLLDQRMLEEEVKPRARRSTSDCTCPPGPKGDKGRRGRRGVAVSPHISHVLQAVHRFVNHRLLRKRGGELREEPFSQLVLVISLDVELSYLT
ncbi:uncharacterized protein LOC144411710 [Styela clava]